MKKLILSISLIFMTMILLHGQSPNAFNFQAAVRNSDGESVTNQAVAFKFSLELDGQILYVETHNVTTSAQGTVSLAIGEGQSSDDFTTIDWSAGTVMLNPEIDITGGTNFTVLNSQRILSVPVALHAKTVDNKDDADADPFNEIQELSIVNNEMKLSGIETGVSLTPYLDNTDEQALSKTGNDLNLVDGGTVNLTEYLDNTDEQDLTLESNTLSLTGDATSVDLSGYLDNSDDQALSKTGNDLNLEDGGTVNLTEYLDNTDEQDLTLVTNTLSLTGDATSVDLSGYLDNTDDQALSKTGNDLNLESGGTVDLSEYLDNTDEQNLTLTGKILSLTNDPTSVDLSNISPWQQVANDIEYNVGNVKINSGNLTMGVGTQLTAYGGNIGFFSVSDEFTVNSKADFNNDVNVNGILKINNSFSLPTSDGTSGQIFSTDGSGNVSWIENNSTDNQSISLSNNTLTIENGGSINLASYLDNTDDQSVSLLNNELTIERGGSVDLSAYIDNTDNQQISVNGNELSIENGNTVSLNVNDNDSDSSNEIQFLTLTNNNLNLSLTDDLLSVNLTPLFDNTDNQQMTFSNNVITLEDGGSVDLSEYENQLPFKVDGTSMYIPNVSNIDPNTFTPYNTYLGSSSGISSTTCASNTYIGSEAGYSTTNGGGNTFIGARAGYSSTGSNSTFVGTDAGANSIGGSRNTFIGNTSGNENNGGSSNTFIGHASGNSNTTGWYNTYIGEWSGYSNTIGDRNIFIGKSAGYFETGSNKLYIANSDTSTPLIYGVLPNDYVQINGSLNITDVVNLKPLATAPVSPSKGDMYFDDTTNKLRVWDGTVWQNCY